MDGALKILHFADLHLGVENYGTIDPETGLSTRVLDFLKALDQVVDHALEKQVDLVLFCGDAYKNRDPSQTIQREFAKRLKRLTSASIPAFLLVGNHDLPNALGRATAVDIFQTLDIRNVHVANRPDIHRIQTAHGPLQIAALPWARRSYLLSKEENKNLTIQQTNERLKEILTNFVQGFVSSLDPGQPAVLAGHVSLSSATYGSERSTIVGQEPVLVPSSVVNPAFDYIALGHVHKHQVLSETPFTVYAGSLERIDFSEEKEEKGFCLAEIDTAGGKRKTDFSFIKIETRRFLTLSVEIGEQDTEPNETVLRAIARRQDEARGAIVRLQISVPAQLQGSLRENDIRKALKEAHYVLPPAINITGREARVRLAVEGVEELSPYEALKAYLLAKKVSPERTQVLLQYGDKLIKDSQAKE